MWLHYRNTSEIKNDEQLLAMMRQVVLAADLLKQINERCYSLVINDLVAEWRSLKSIAEARGIKNVPSLV